MRLKSAKKRHPFRVHSWKLAYGPERFRNEIDFVGVASIFLCERINHGLQENTEVGFVQSGDGSERYVKIKANNLLSTYDDKAR